ncbi:hypothetical protein ACH4ZX_04990 [Streptomyces sp. NPDC020490]|uniref:hypothetical protein n=1 Tax=Streptomyces sp. NPDC020490 TaxID=3365078 RepID=UPI0037B52303
MPTSVHVRRPLPACALSAALLLSGCGLHEGSGSPAVQGPITLGFVNGGTTEFHTCLQESVEEVAQSNLADIRTATPIRTRPRNWPTSRT